jgi:hypothetical protein
MRNAFRLLKLSAIFFCGFGVLAQTQVGRFDEIIPISHYPLQTYYKIFDKLSTYKGDLRIGKTFGDYFFLGNIYRKLSPYERLQLDAMTKIRVEHGKLYFDGIEINTNEKNVVRIDSAYYWKGGILVGGEVILGGRKSHNSQEDAFINLQTNECHFTRPNNKLGGGNSAKDFLVGVTINTQNKFLLFEVNMPEKVSKDERIEYSIKLTNVSKNAVLLPDDLYEGLGISRICDSMTECLDASDAASLDLSETRFWRDGYSRFEKLPDLTEKPERPYSLLKPSETRSAKVTLKRELLPSSHKLQILFFWDGLLNPSDRNEITRFACQKIIEVNSNIPFAINNNGTSPENIVTSPGVKNSDLKPDAEIGEMDCYKLLLNKSDHFNIISRPAPLGITRSMVEALPGGWGHNNSNYNNFNLSRSMQWGADCRDYRRYVYNSFGMSVWARWP